MVPQNVLLRPLRDDAENEKPHLWLHEICHCTEVEGAKCAVVCYFQCRMFNPTNILNHVAPSIQLVMQI